MSEKIILMGDPQVAAVPVIECDEPLGVAGPHLVRSTTRADQEPHRSYLRTGVLDRLSRAATELPPGLQLLWVEGYRRPELQESLFEGYRAKLRDTTPELDDDKSYQLASRYVSPPAVAPHVSGAAIDLTLCDTTGAELDMGTAVNANPEESAGACYFAAPVAPAARRNRDILAAALTKAGLVNYPTEWWHWSYGDRYWALTTEQTHSIYGPKIADTNQ